MPQSHPSQATVSLLVLALAGLAACSAGRPTVSAAVPASAEARALPARPLGEQSPDLLAAWSRTDAEWAHWTDPAAKHVRLVTVPGDAKGPVRLEILDWGGHGPALVLLAGLGENGHIYNDLAPRLTDRFRVIALTRRGHGASSWTDTSTYVLDTFVTDIAAVMDSLS
jgi:alpha/beta hydrolase family protein